MRKLGYDSFQVIDATNPLSPSLLGGVTTTYSSDRLTLSNDIALTDNHKRTVKKPAIILQKIDTSPRESKNSENDA